MDSLEEDLLLLERLRGSNARQRRLSIAAIAMVAFVVLGVGIELVFLPQASSGASSRETSSRTTTLTTPYCQGGGPSCEPPAQNLSAAVAQWVGDINARDVEGLSDLYSSDTVVNWTVSHDFIASGLVALSGVYDGVDNVRILYGSVIGKTTSLVANVSDYKVRVIDPDDANVSLTLNMTGTSSVAGNISISVDAEQQWNYVGGQWQIARETWTFVAFYEQFPVAATTFPQWTAMEEGQNPNLVEEKSFEWHAGPYIAASVYAFLAGLLAYGAVRLRRKGRYGKISQ